VSKRRKKRAVRGVALSYTITDKNGESEAYSKVFQTDRRLAYLHPGALKAMEAKLQLQERYRGFQKARYDHGNSYGDKYSE
jgi:hypothetical protein